MGEIEFTETEQVVLEQIKAGASFETICKSTTLSPHCVKSVFRSIVQKLDIQYPEIIAIKQFCDKK